MSEQLKSAQNAVQLWAGSPSKYNIPWDAIAVFIDEIEKLQAEVESFHELVNESHGVVGWHLNGNVATWDELGYAKEDE